MIDKAMAISTQKLGRVTTFSAASDSVTECETVKAVTILTTGQALVAHSTTASRKQRWS